MVVYCERENNADSAGIIYIHFGDISIHDAFDIALRFLAVPCLIATRSNSLEDVQ